MSDDDSEVAGEATPRVRDSVNGLGKSKIQERSDGDLISHS